MTFHQVALDISPGCYLYTLSRLAKGILGISHYEDKIRLERISHDILVVDSVIYLTKLLQIDFSDILSEKEVHSLDGFGNRNHAPDFLIKAKGVKIAIEIELSLKSKSRLEANLKHNYTKYDQQIWIVPKNEHVIRKIIEESPYNDIKIIESEVVTNYKF